jgi:polyferredoxin
MSAGLAADLILVVHALIVALVVLAVPVTWLGAVLGWAFVRSRSFRIGHLAVIAFVTATAWLGEYCPLTVWENTLRVQAGQEGYGESFIGYWLARLLYVDLSLEVLAVIYTLFLGLVLANFRWVPMRSEGRSNP